MPKSLNTPPYPVFPQKSLSHAASDTAVNALPLVSLHRRLSELTGNQTLFPEKTTSLILLSKNLPKPLFLATTLPEMRRCTPPQPQTRPATVAPRGGQAGQLPTLERTAPLPRCKGDLAHFRLGRGYPAIDHGEGPHDRCSVEEEEDNDDEEGSLREANDVSDDNLPTPSHVNHSAPVPSSLAMLEEDYSLRVWSDLTVEMHGRQKRIGKGFNTTRAPPLNSGTPRPSSRTPPTHEQCGSGLSDTGNGDYSTDNLLCFKNSSNTVCRSNRSSAISFNSTVAVADDSKPHEAATLHELECLPYSESIAHRIPTTLLANSQLTSRTLYKRNGVIHLY